MVSNDQYEEKDHDCDSPDSVQTWVLHSDRQFIA